jgi:Flp pilus assembly protein TadG
MARRTDARCRGQALVEFSLALIVFLALLMAVFDLGRGIYMYNGVSEAVREIARVTSVHPGATLGTSAETAAVVATQKGLIPNLGSPTFTCVDIDDTPVSGSCTPGMRVKVSIVARYRPVTPLLGLVGPFDLASASSIQIP